MRGFVLLACLVAAAYGERVAPCASYRAALSALKGTEHTNAGQLAARALGEAVEAECGGKEVPPRKAGWPSPGFFDSKTWQVDMSEPERDWVRSLFFEDPH